MLYRRAVAVSTFGAVFGGAAWPAGAASCRMRWMVAPYQRPPAVPRTPRLLSAAAMASQERPAARSATISARVAGARVDSEYRAAIPIRRRSGFPQQEVRQRRDQHQRADHVEREHERQQDAHVGLELDR